MPAESWSKIIGAVKDPYGVTALVVLALLALAKIFSMPSSAKHRARAFLILVVAFLILAIMAFYHRPTQPNVSPMFKLLGNDGTVRVTLNGDLILMRRYRQGTLPQFAKIEPLRSGDNELRVTVRNGTGSWSVAFQIDGDGDGSFEKDIRQRGSGPNNRVVFDQTYSIRRDE